jgi:hypothetical protein
MVLSIIAVVFSLAGTGAASVATISALSKKEKNQTRGIADGEINRLAPTLSVKSAGSANTASSANTAANANLLGGSDPSSFLSSSRVKRVDGDLTQSTDGSNATNLLTMGPLTLGLTCQRSGSTQSLFITASSTASNASAGFGLSSSASPNASGADNGLTGSPTTVMTRSESVAGQAGGGELVYRDSSTTIALTFRYQLDRTVQKCQLFGVAVQA